MSEPIAPAPRPVSWAAVVAVLVGFGLFLVPLYYGYVKHRPARLFIPESAPADGLSSNLQWQGTAAGRLDYLAQLRTAHEKQLSTYAWIDRQKGVVQLPIDRAMELIVRQYGKKQP